MSSFGLFSLLCVVAVAVQASSHHKKHHRLPIIQLNGAEELIGTLREDERVVSISPRLSIYPDTGPVCKYELTSSSKEELPFEVEILDKHEGTAVVRVKSGAPAIDCSHSEYSVEVVAVRCADDLARSTPAILKITVKDVNNHAPEFDAPWYSFDVEEGKVVTDIARLYTSDKDCGHPYGKICRYEITNALEGFPFHIDDQGVLSNVRPLNRSEAESHILTVVAYDCGMQRSKSTLVTINVRRSCVDGLRNVPKNDASAIQHMPGTGARTLLPDAELVICPSEKKCDVKSASVDLELGTVQDESVDEGSLTKKCGTNLKTIELLPQPKVAKERDVIIGKDGKEKELLLESAENLSKVEKDILAKVDAAEEDDDDGEDEDDNDEDLSSDVKKTDSSTDRFLFDGKTTSIVVSNVDKVIPEKFSLSFSMKHARGSKEEQKQKQNILCETDELNMNRHHFAVYIRHCKLELLLRREAAHASAEFRAAEWRWEAPEICDDEWHSFAIQFTDLDNVALFIDGRKFESNERNPEILDDWPLHETKDVKTKLVAGACWHGRGKQMVQHFKGRLQNMYLLVNEVEQEAAIECLHQPAERLSFNEELDKGEHASFSKQQTHLTLTANNLEDLSALLQKVQYVNTAASSHPGKRRLIVSPSVMCGTEKQALASYETTIQVKKPQDPVLSISGQNLINMDRHSLKLGTVMLPDLQITVTQTLNGKSEDVTDKYSLDWCKLHMKPARNMEVEYFSSPAALIASMNVDFEHDEEGILLKGNERINNYREILSKIHYFNTRADSYNKRLYTVQCAMDKGKTLSNEYFVTMNIDGELDEAIEKLQRASKKLEEDQDKNDFVKHFEPSAFDQLGANRLQNILEMDLPRPKALLSHHGAYEMGQGAVAGGAVAIVVVICVGFLLVLLVVGVLKMRDTPVPRRRRSRKNPSMQHEEGMEWDNTAMTITVNPLDDVEKQEQAAYSEEEEDEDDSSEGESYHDDEYSDDEESETMPALPHSPTGGRQGLEWDEDGLQDSTNVSRTYRV